jgi:hypothetical protein
MKRLYQTWKSNDYWLCFEYLTSNQYAKTNMGQDRYNLSRQILISSEGNFIHEYPNVKIYTLDYEPYIDDKIIAKLILEGFNDMKRLPYLLKACSYGGGIHENT